MGLTCHVSTKARWFDLGFCSDYRLLNSVTKKDCYPLPHVQDIFAQMGGSKWFSTLDLKSGYWQCPMDPSSVEKTAFITHQGLYQYKVMPFGLCNAPGVFQRLMQEILHDMIGKFVMVYIDDIVIYSSLRVNMRKTLGK